MKNAVCTIITPDYLHYALGLQDSLIESGWSDFHFFIFISDFKANTAVVVDRTNTTLLYVDDLNSSTLGHDIFNAYFNADMDKYRWSMKSVLILDILRSRRFEKVMCVDCDINFYASPEFLLDELNDHSVLLTPHFRASDPSVDMHNYLLMYTEGIYNAGFIAVSQKGTEAMDWWGRACLAICEKNASKGQFVDQTHLNLLPVFFDGVQIVKHRGCNLALWNIIECKRTLKENGEVAINEDTAVIFIHFTSNTVKNIRFGNDRLLNPHLNKYLERLVRYKSDYEHPAIKRYLENQAKKREQPGLSERAMSKLKRLLKK
jgi:hypothetical protein